MIFFYLKMLFKMKNSFKKFDKNENKKIPNTVKRITVVLLLNFLCWLPISFLGFPLLFF